MNEDLQGVTMVAMSSGLERLKARRVKAIIDRFHRLYYDNAGRTWWDTRWLGTPVRKCPLDLWIYQELVTELRPDLIVETGTFVGGSALYLASCLDLVGTGRVVTIDIAEHPGRPDHDRITYVVGSSTAPETLARITAEAEGAGDVMVVLDSNHSRDHVLNELRLYGPLVTPDSYIIVEDTNINGRPVFPNHGPGPHEAVEAFLAESDDFVRDRAREKFYLTFNPGGFLRRVTVRSASA
jgi:cephalosporin hydroxylase